LFKFARTVNEIYEIIGDMKMQIADIKIDINCECEHCGRKYSPLAYDEIGDIIEAISKKIIGVKINDLVAKCEYCERDQMISLEF